MPKEIDVIYENGVFKPLKPIDDIKEHTKIRVIIEFDKKKHERAKRIVSMAQDSLKGLSQEEIRLLEQSRLDNRDFFHNRIETE